METMKNKLMKMLVVSMLVVVMASSAMAATIDLLPTWATATWWDNNGCSASSYEYQCVNAFDAKNLSTASIDREEVFSFQNLPVNGTYTINSVTLKYYAKEYDSANDKFKSLLVTGLGQYASGYFLLSSSWVVKDTVWLLHPDTGLAWTESDVNNLLAGMTTAGLTSGDAGAKINKVWAVIDYTN